MKKIILSALLFSVLFCLAHKEPLGVETLSQTPIRDALQKQALDLKREKKENSFF